MQPILLTILSGFPTFNLADLILLLFLRGYFM